MTLLKVTVRFQDSAPSFILFPKIDYECIRKYLVNKGWSVGSMLPKNNYTREEERRALAEGRSIAQFERKKYLLQGRGTYHNVGQIF